MKIYFRNKNFVIGLFLISLLLIICIGSFFYTPYPPNEMDAEFRYESPGFQFLMGTDNFGRDIFSRIMVGSRTAFFVGFLSVSLGLFLGFIIGSISGYFGGMLDLIFTRLIDIIMTFPTVLFALMLITVFGSGTLNMVLILGISATPRFARLIRGCFLKEKNMTYVKSAKSRGAGSMRIMFFHILPNIMPPIIVNASFSFSMSVLTEAALSYIGLGIQPPNPSWGRMLNEAQPYLQQAPWYVFFTGLVLVVLVLGFNLLGDGINEVNNGK